MNGFAFHRALAEYRFIDLKSGDVIRVMGAETPDARFQIWLATGSVKKTFTSETMAVTAFKLYGPLLFQD